jgi:predicted RNA-binding protein YlqC (UPF0109 family)
MGFWSKLFGGGTKTETVESAPEKKQNSSASGKNGNNNSRPARAVSLQDLEGFVEFVAKSLVDFPDELKVCSESTADGKMIKIICLASDRGKIIGKKGKTIMALRALVAGAAGRTRERISVEVPDDVDSAKD